MATHPPPPSRPPWQTDELSQEWLSPPPSLSNSDSPQTNALHSRHRHPSSTSFHSRIPLPVQHPSSSLPGHPSRTSSASSALPTPSTSTLHPSHNHPPHPSRACSSMRVSSASSDPLLRLQKRSESLDRSSRDSQKLSAASIVLIDDQPPPQNTPPWLKAAADGMADGLLGKKLTQLQKIFHSSPPPSSQHHSPPSCNPAPPSIPPTLVEPIDQPTSDFDESLINPSTSPPGLPFEPSLPPPPPFSPTLPESPFDFSVPRSCTSLRALSRLDDSFDYLASGQESSQSLFDHQDHQNAQVQASSQPPILQRLGYIRDNRLAEIAEETEPSTSIDSPHASQILDEQQPSHSTNPPRSIPFAHRTPTFDSNLQLLRLESSSDQVENPPIRSSPPPGSSSHLVSQTSHSFHSTHSASAASQRLFRFTYDTFARKHLSRLADEIDGFSLLQSLSPLKDDGKMKIKSVLGSPGDEITDQSSSVGLAHSTPPGLIFVPTTTQKRIVHAGRTPFRPTTTNLTQRWREEHEWRESFVEPNQYALESLSITQPANEHPQSQHAEPGADLEVDENLKRAGSFDLDIHHLWSHRSSKRIRLSPNSPSNSGSKTFNNRKLKDSVQLSNERAARRKAGRVNAHPMVVFKRSCARTSEDVPRYPLNVSSSGSAPPLVRDRLEEARALMDRIRAKKGLVADAIPSLAGVKPPSGQEARGAGQLTIQHCPSLKDRVIRSVPPGHSEASPHHLDDIGGETDDIAAEGYSDDGDSEVFDERNAYPASPQEGRLETSDFDWAVGINEDIGDARQLVGDEELSNPGAADHAEEGKGSDRFDNDTEFQSQVVSSMLVHEHQALNATSSLRQEDLSDGPVWHQEENFARHGSAGPAFKGSKRQLATQPVLHDSTGRNYPVQGPLAGSNQMSSSSTAVTTMNSSLNPTLRNSLNTTVGHTNLEVHSRQNSNGKWGLMTIAPRDVEDLLQNPRVGKMVFDSTSGKWVKARSQSDHGGFPTEVEEEKDGKEELCGESSSDEEDIFKDIESLTSRRDAQTPPAVASKNMLSSRRRMESENATQPTLTDQQSHPNTLTNTCTKVEAHTSRSISLITRRSFSHAMPKSVLKPIDGPLADEPSCGMRPSRSVSFQDGRKNGKIVGLDDLGAETPPALTPRLPRTREFDEFGLHQSHSTSSSLVLMSSTKKVRRKSSLKLHSPHLHHPHQETVTSNSTSECSFGLNYERLVKLITDVEPFEPYWSTIKVMDLSSRRLDSVVKLREILPSLDQIDIHSNQLTYLNGLPESVRMLLVGDNQLSDLTSFGHLKHLERADLSRNSFTSLQQLSGLKHLREVKIDDNMIEDLVGLYQVDGLVKLSLKGNRLKRLNFEAANWSRLEVLNLDRNQIVEVRGVHQLCSMYSLNLDRNQLYSLDITQAMPSLRILRLSENRLERIDVSKLVNLRTLYIDNNDLMEIAGASQLRKLENLSARDQRGSELSLSMKQVRDVKRMYLGGNPLPSTFPTHRFYNLVYLELAMCQCESLPSDLARLIPNIRTLNLNYNFLQDLSPLSNLLRLEKLTVVGSRIKQVDRRLIKILESLPELELLDLRQNPLTLSFYPPLLAHTSSGTGTKASIAPHLNQYEISTSHSSDWRAIDDRFRKSLPNQFYLRRMTYRSILAGGTCCKRLKVLDGIKIGESERRKMGKFLRGLSRKLGDESSPASQRPAHEYVGQAAGPQQSPADGVDTATPRPSRLEEGKQGSQEAISENSCVIDRSRY